MTTRVSGSNPILNRRGWGRFRIPSRWSLDISWPGIDWHNWSASATPIRRTTMLFHCVCYGYDELHIRSRRLMERGRGSLCKLDSGGSWSEPKRNGCLPTFPKLVFPEKRRRDRNGAELVKFMERDGCYTVDRCSDEEDKQYSGPPIQTHYALSFSFESFSRKLFLRWTHVVGIDFCYVTVSTDMWR